MRPSIPFLSSIRALAGLFFLLALRAPNSSAQESSPKSTEKPATNQAEKPTSSTAPELPAVIELLETRIRFEANGDSRKEVHARVRINNELGVSQFARLNFDFNRSFESVEVPFVRITHPSGGTADILPSAITDNPNPAVINAPAYQDVRVKSVRVLGLIPGDMLEFRVITTVSHHPLAPDFWLDHTFDRTGLVSHEIFELDLPASRNPQVRINSATRANSTQECGEGDAARSIYHWERPATDTSTRSQTPVKEVQEAEPDVVVSTEGWEHLSIRLDELLRPGAKPLEKIDNYEEPMQEIARRNKVAPEISAKALELTSGVRSNRGKFEAVYQFVSQKITTIDLPLGVTMFVARPATEIVASGYATPEDKFVLFAALAATLKLGSEAALTGYCDAKGLARPSVFKHLLIYAEDEQSSFWLDPSLEVAPFGMIPPNSGKCAFVLNRAFLAMNSTGHEWQKLKTTPPFPSTQRVAVKAKLDPDGTLGAKVRYAMRGDNELLLRVAFHQSPKEKWKELAQILSISDGFRGTVTSVNVSDPYATKEPFTVEYEIEQPKFADWSKKPLRMPALLPQLGLPEPAAKPKPEATSPPIELGTPLEVETQMTLHLPLGTSVVPPTGTSVQRDYATFSSQYAVQGQTISASRHIHFLLEKIPADRAADYNAFLRAVQNDEAQTFSLEPKIAPSGKPPVP